MHIARAVITTAAASQRHLPVQTLVDRDGAPKSLLRILVEMSLSGGVEEVCAVIYPGDQDACAQALGTVRERVTFVSQSEQRGYGDAVLCAAGFVAGEPFLHLIGDHVFVSTSSASCAEQLVATAKEHACSVSAVAPTREGHLTSFGAVGGRRVQGSDDLFTIERVMEKPTPTQAEEHLIVPGLRAGRYLCFSGMHVLTPAIMDILSDHARRLSDGRRLELSPALDELARRERYLAMELRGLPYPVDAPYGLLTAQLALALSGGDRADVLARLCELLAERELAAAALRA